MADILGINGITGTFTERQEIHRIQQVRFPHAVLSKSSSISEKCELTAPSSYN